MSAIPKQNEHFYQFGPFHLDVNERLLFRAEEVVPLTPKVLDTLLVLIENRGHLVSKDAVMSAVWPDTFVEESSLTQNISLLRKALGENGDGRQYIETLPRRGYRFTGEVQEVCDESGGFLLHRHTNAQILVEEDEEDEIHSAGPLAAPAISASRLTNRLWSTRTILVIAGVAVALAVGSYFWQSRNTANVELRPKSIAVLPFQTLGDGPATEPLGLGMADALILRFANVEQMSVLPTSSVFKYMKRDADALAIGRDLGVDAVLDGTIQRSGDRLRVTAQLVRVSDGKSLWAGKFDEPQRDIFVIQDSVSEQLVHALAIKVGSKENQPRNMRLTNSTEAYQLYTMGLYFWNKRTSDGLFQAIDYFTQATEKDPQYALAYARLSDSYMLVGHYNYRNLKTADVLPNIRAAAMRAVELDPTLSEAQAAMAVVKALDGQFEEAIALYQRAIELSANSATAHLRYSYLLANAGRLDDAISNMKRAHELDPFSSTININLSAFSLYKGRPDEAIRFARLALVVNPEAWQAQVNIGEAYEAKSMYAEAEAEYRKLEQAGQAVVAKQQLAYLYALRGNRAEARKLVAELQAAYQRRQTPRASTTAHNLALVYIALGQPDDAFTWLNKAFDSRGINRADFLYGAKLNPLRQDPRFAILTERIDARHREASIARR